jgi:hypothetical protein
MRSIPNQNSRFDFAISDMMDSQSPSVDCELSTICRKETSMDAKALASVDISNPAEVKKVQQVLKASGYYTGPIDGKWGGGTTDAIAALRRDEDDRARTAAASAEANVKLQTEKNAGDSRKMLMEMAPYVGGIGAGMLTGHVAHKIISGEDVRMADAAKRMSANAEIDPVVREQSLKSMKRNRMLRAAGQFGVPGIIAGGAYATRNVLAPAASDETQREMINAIGLGEQAAALTTGAHQAFSSILRGNKLDPEIEALIRSDAERARRGEQPNRLAAAGAKRSGGGTPRNRMLEAAAVANELSGAQMPSKPASGEPAPRAAAPGTKAYMQEQVKALGIKGTSGMSKADIADAIAVKMQEHGGRRTVGKRVAAAAGRGSAALAPLVAGGVAYDAATSDAEASGATPGEARTRGAAAGAAAGGATAGAAYGINRLAQTLSPIARAAMGAGASVMAPMAAVDMVSDPAEDQRAIDAYKDSPEYASRMEWAGRNLPSWMQTGDMAAAAERSQRRADAWSGYEDPEAKFNEAAPPSFDDQLSEMSSIFGEIDRRRTRSSGASTAGAPR